MANERTDLTAEAVKINGTYLEDAITGFTTLTTTGRESLTKEIVTNSSKRDGTVINYTKYPEREITVKFVLETDSSGTYREKYSTILGMLDGEEANIQFNDDADKYLTGTISVKNPEEKYGYFCIGNYTINCSDPFKYSTTEYVVAASSNQWSITYDGTYPSHPTFVFDFPKTLDSNGNNTATSECGFVGLATQNGAILQFGDPEETDWGSISEPAIKPIDKTFQKQDWSPNSGKTLGANYVEAGSMSVNTTDKYVYPSGFGSGTYTAWHGPTISKTFTNSTYKNWQFTWKQLFTYGSGQEKKQFGCFTALVFNNNNGTRTLIAAIGLEKSEKNKNTKVFFYGNDNYTAKNAKKPLKIACNDVRTCSIKKQNKVLTFNVGGKSDTLELSDTVAAKYANEVVFYFGQQKTNTALTTNRLFNCTMELFSYSHKGDIQNAFQPGQIFTIDTSKAEIFLDSGDSTTPANELGALGNDWESFKLVPGTNIVGAEYSSFTTTPPTATMRYRKVYL